MNDRTIPPATPLEAALDRIMAPTPAQQWLLDQGPVLARLKAEREAERTCIFCAATLDADDERPFCDHCNGSDC